MVEDPKWELAILATVQGFYEKLLQEPLAGEVPVPLGLEAISLQQSEGDVHETLSIMRRWLRLLDMAITPAMLRCALTPDTDPEIAEAMLRYLVRHKDANEVNRSKTDLVTTFLYRHPRVPGQWERRGLGLDGSLPLSPFEIALIEILADSDVPSLPEEHVQLLRQFDPLLNEVKAFRDFSALIDSGIISRVRDLKKSLESSFYHPGVLATIAPYNAAFGAKFDGLFAAAVTEIKNFAELLQEQGGSILSNVDGVDVTVDHVAAMDRDELLKSDYSHSLERFQRVAKLRTALERRPPIRRIQRPLPLPAPSRAPAGANGRGSPARRTVSASVTPQQLAIEESKLLRVQESIRIFVRVADPKFRQVVPMRFFNLTLTAAEANAYCADLEQKTTDAQVARVLVRIVGVVARMSTELEEMNRSQNSVSLWKLHADCLMVLQEVAAKMFEVASSEIAALHQKPGAQEHIQAIHGSLQKLRERLETVQRTFAEAASEAVL